MNKTVGLNKDVYKRLVVYTGKLTIARKQRHSLSNAVDELLMMVEDTDD